MVAREMQIAPTSCRLSTEITEIIQIIIPDKNVEHIRPVCHSFLPIQLVNRLKRRFNAHQMLCLINKDGLDLQAFQGIDDGITQVEPGYRITGFSTELGRKCEI